MTDFDAQAIRDDPELVADLSAALAEVERLTAENSTDIIQLVREMAAVKMERDNALAEVERLTTRVEWFEKSGGVAAHTRVFQEMARAENAEAEVARLEQQMAEMARERDEALCLAEGPSTLHDLAAECGRCLMNEHDLEAEVARLTKERDAKQQAWEAFREVAETELRDVTAERDLFKQSWQETGQQIAALEADVARLTTELRCIDAVMARRPALDKDTRWQNVEHAIVVAGRADAWQRRAEQAEADVARLTEELTDWKGRAERQYDENVRLIAEVARLTEELDDAGHECSRQFARAAIAEGEVARLTEERDEAVAWITVVRDELVQGGGLSGDRTVALANLRAMIARVVQLETALRAAIQLAGDCAAMPIDTSDLARILDPQQR